MADTLDEIFSEVILKAGIERRYVSRAQASLSSHRDFFPDESLFDYSLLFLYLTGQAKVQSERIRYLSDLSMLYRSQERQVALLMGRVGEQGVDLLGHSPAVIYHFKREITFDDIMPSIEVLRQYVLGNRDIKGFGRIETQDDLRVLGSFQASRDRRLCNLMRRIEREHRRERRPTLAEMVDDIGQEPETIDYFGWPVSFGDVGRPTHVSDGKLLVRYLIGDIMIKGADGTFVQPSSPSDLFLFNPYNGKHGISHPDKRFEALMKRLARRGALADDFSKAGSHGLVIEKYGRSIVYNDVKVQSMLQSYKAELAACMLGIRQLNILGARVIVSSREDLRFLMPYAHWSDSSVKRLAKRVDRTARLTGLDFYGLIDLVGQWEPVRERYGIVSREVISSRKETSRGYGIWQLAKSPL